MSTEIIPMSGRATALVIGASALPMLVERAGAVAKLRPGDFQFDGVKP